MIQHQRHHAIVEARQIGPEMLGVCDLDIAQFRLPLQRYCSTRERTRREGDRHAIIAAAMNDDGRQEVALADARNSFTPVFTRCASSAFPVTRSRMQIAPSRLKSCRPVLGDADSQLRRGPVGSLSLTTSIIPAGAPPGATENIVRPRRHRDRPPIRIRCGIAVTAIRSRTSKRP